VRAYASVPVVAVGDVLHNRGYHSVVHDTARHAAATAVVIYVRNIARATDFDVVRTQTIDGANDTTIDRPPPPPRTLDVMTSMRADDNSSPRHCRRRRRRRLRLPLLEAVETAVAAGGGGWRWG